MGKISHCQIVSARTIIDAARNVEVFMAIHREKKASDPDLKQDSIDTLKSSFLLLFYLCQ